MINYVETAELPTGELREFPGNAKRGDVDAIRDSLRRNGQYRSLIVRDVDGERTVLAGNHTLKALIAEGVAVARCEVVRCDDATARRVNLADNRTAELGAYDDDALAVLLRSLDGDYAGTGYTDEAVSDLVAALDLPEEVSYTASETSWNDNADDVDRRIRSHGGYDSATMESRGIRDIVLALPSADADELGRCVIRLRDRLGPVSQGEVVLAAARIAVAAMDCDCFGAADAAAGE